MLIWNSVLLKNVLNSILIQFLHLCGVNVVALFDKFRKKVF